MTHHTIAAPPYEVAEGTWVIPELFPTPDGLYVAMNSAVITGSEPVLVDTGNALNRDRWLDAVGSVVDFADVRWIFISHDDHDHTGNLEQALELAPNATLVTTWWTVERLAGDVRLPHERMRWVRDGESFDVGDRTLLAVRPPVFDAPTTRGLFDPTTGVYWAADCFATLLPGTDCTNAADTPAELWEGTFLHFGSLVSPWHTLVDAVKYDEAVARVERLGATTVIGGHMPALDGERLGRSFDLLRQLPHIDAAQEPAQADLDAMIAMALAPA